MYGIILIFFFILFFLIFIIIKIISLFFNSVDYINDKSNVIHDNGGFSYMNRQCNFGSTGNKIVMDNVDFFREIPSDDIFRVYWIVYNYQLGDRDEDFLLAIFLKWIRDGNIILVDKSNDNNKESNIIFNMEPNNKESMEYVLYTYMKNASIGNNVDGKIDNILTKEEFKEWCINNYNNIIGFFSAVLDYEIHQLIDEKKIIVRKCKPDPSSKSKYQLVYDVDSSMMDEAKKIAGLKKFLQEFSLINYKEPIEVKLWDSYLIYAAMFGIADEVANKMKSFNSDFNKCIDNITYLKSITSSGIKDARMINDSYKKLINSRYFTSNFSKNSNNFDDILLKALDYSSGGGGFSSGGGGGGSFGSGGGGGGFR